MRIHSLTIVFQTPFSLPRLERHMGSEAVMIILTNSSFKWSLRSLISHKAILLDCSPNALESFNKMLCCSPWAHPTSQFCRDWLQFSPQPLLLRCWGYLRAQEDCTQAMVLLKQGQGGGNKELQGFWGKTIWPLMLTETSMPQTWSRGHRPISAAVCTTKA